MEEKNSQPMAETEGQDINPKVSDKGEGAGVGEGVGEGAGSEKKSFLKSLSSMTLSDLFKKKNKEESAAPKKESSFSAFLKSINNLGMGKQAHLYVQSVATMLDAGLPLLDSLKTFQMETRNRTMKKVISKIVYDIENGSAFWKAMADRHLFTPYDIAMVQIGEEAGNLAQNMKYLA